MNEVTYYWKQFYPFNMISQLNFMIYLSIISFTLGVCSQNIQKCIRNNNEIYG